MHVRVAYLVNHYPKISHTFIRREVLTLEERGVGKPLCRHNSLLASARFGQPDGVELEGDEIYV